MILEKLEIERTPSWRNPARPLVGKVQFGSKNGTEITLPLSEESARRILELCAAGMVEAAGDVARLTAANIIEDVPALENKVPE